MKQNGFVLNKELTKHYWDNRKIVFFNHTLDTFKIFRLFEDNGKEFDLYGIKEYGIQALEYGEKEHNTRFLSFK